MNLNFNKIIAWLKRNKIDYTIKDNIIVLFHDANGCVEFVFNSGRSTYKAPRGCLIPSSAADDSDFYVKVGDWGKWINEFIKWAKDRGYYEYNHYHCAQWGTWKFGNFISMSFFGVFIKKILALKNEVNESMQLDEAKKILNENGFILEDAMHDRAMARVNRAYQHVKDLHYDDLDPMHQRHGSEDWEEGGHAEYDYTNKDYSDSDEKEEFGKKVAKKLVDYFKPIYAKKGFVPDEYDGGDNKWDWTIRDILGNYMYHAVRLDNKLSFMDVDEAVKYVIPTAAKVLDKCWDKKMNWFDIYKFEYPEED